MRRVSTLAALLLTAACAPAPKPAPVKPLASPAPTRPQPVITPEQPRDQCGAAALQYLVGKPKTEIPVPVEIDNRRVTCTTCPITEEFVAKRLNIFFDAGTGLVTEVRCG